MDIIVRERLYVPADAIDIKTVKKRYRHRFYDEQQCRKCDNRVERHNYLCNKCPAFTNQTVNYNERTRNGILYYGLPLGDRENVEDAFNIDFDDFTIQDKRCRAKRRYPLKMVGFKPYDYQVPAIQDMKDSRYGILKAPPRSGKTPTMLYAGVKAFPYRMVMIADQREFLDQFIDHVERFTNIQDLEERTGKKLYGYASTEEQFNDYEIAVCTYQTFLSDNGKKLLKHLNRNFGTMFLDECHSAAAPRYSEIVNNIRSVVRIGATGTDERKDGRIKIIKQIIGDVTALIEVPQLVANVYVHPINFTKSRAKFVGKAGFARLINFVSAHEKRNDMIIEWALKDIASGHSIVIPVERKEHVWLLVKRINDEHGDIIAAGFTGGAGNKAAKSQRTQSLADAVSGKIRVVVGIRSLLQRGLNVPRWSMMYGVMPINNEPNWKQESSRILTPMEGKRQPAIRLFVDENLGMMLNCAIQTYKQCILFNHVPTKTAKERYALLLKKLNASHKDRREDSALLEADDTKVYKSKTTFGGLFERKK